MRGGVFLLLVSPDCEESPRFMQSNCPSGPLSPCSVSSAPRCGPSCVQCVRPDRGDVSSSSAVCCVLNTQPSSQSCAVRGKQSVFSPSAMGPQRGLLLLGVTFLLLGVVKVIIWWCDFPDAWAWDTCLWDSCRQNVVCEGGLRIYFTVWTPHSLHIMLDISLLCHSDWMFCGLDCATFFSTLVWLLKTHGARLAERQQCVVPCGEMTAGVWV